MDKNQRKPDDSPNDTESDEKQIIVKPQLSPGRPNAENNNEVLSQRVGDRPVDTLKTNGRSDENSLELSLPEADRQRVEDEKRRNSENADHSMNNGNGDLKQNTVVRLVDF